MTQFEDILETILEEYARRDSEGEFDTWEETDAFVKEKAEVLLAYVKEEPVSKEIDDYDHKAVMESLHPELKEEPVSIWHDASENPKEEEYLICAYKDNRYHIGKIYKDEFDRLLVSDNKNIIELCMFEKWAYLDDILKLSNAQRTTKNWKEEHVSEELEKAVDNYLKSYWGGEKEKQNWPFLKKMAIHFAKWQKSNLWKPADGDVLPEYDREVIVLIKYDAQLNIYDEEYPTCGVGFGHRPDPKGWDGKSLSTGKVEHYTPKTYGKGGWNIPDIVYWLDCSMPNLEEG